MCLADINMVKDTLSEIQIRPAIPEDAPVISTILYESFVEYRSLYTSNAFSVTTPDPEQVLERMNEGPVWVAVLKNRIVGTASIVVREDGIYIRGMAVVPETRGSKVGWLLLEEIEKFAIAHGHSRLYLSSTPFLHRAIRLYEHYGFRRIDDGPFDLLGTPLFSMEKTLRLDK